MGGGGTINLRLALALLSSYTTVFAGSTCETPRLNHQRCEDVLVLTPYKISKNMNQARSSDPTW